MQDKTIQDMYPRGICMQIRKGDGQGVDIRPYAAKGYDSKVLKQIRQALARGVDIEVYVKRGFDGEQLREIRVALEQKIAIAPYLDEGFCGAQLRQIRKGLRHYIDVNLYADRAYNWLQMREIRIGLQNRVDASVYANPFFSYRQMSEIRLGLEEGIDVSSYARLVYSCMDMREKRVQLTEELYTQNRPLKEIQMIDEGSGIPILLSEDRLEAYMIFPEPQGKLHITADYVEQILRRNGIVYGIDRERIEQALCGKYVAEKVLVAKGLEPETGEEGRYEFYFNTEPSRTPVEMDDGRVDYQNVNIFEEVTAGQKLARYIPPSVGREGMGVRGMALPGLKGREQPVLQGKGFRLLEDGVTYVADMSGIIEYRDNHIQIYETLIIREEVNASYGNINFHGCVQIYGNVGANVDIWAKGSISVEGTVESANIVSGGDVLIKNGMVGGGKGSIRAQGSISGTFFEACTLRAGNNIEAGSLMNSESRAQKQVIIMGRRGSIIGGHTYGVQGVEANNIGNRTQLLTEIETGVGKDVLEKVHVCQERYESAQAELFALERRMERFGVGERDSVTYRNIQAEHRTMKEKAEKARQERAEAQEILMANNNVEVLSKAYSGTVITINQVTRRLDSDYKMVTFCLDNQEIISK